MLDVVFDCFGYIYFVGGWVDNFFCIVWVLFLLEGVWLVDGMFILYGVLVFEFYVNNFILVDFGFCVLVW